MLVLLGNVKHNYGIQHCIMKASVPLSSVAFIATLNWNSLHLFTLLNNEVMLCESLNKKRFISCHLASR